MNREFDSSSPVETNATPSVSNTGKLRRLRRFLSPAGRTLIVPVDDSLIFGPFAGLERIDSKLRAILANPPDAILAFPALFRNHARLLSTVTGIGNLTASTTRSHHTQKVLTGSVHQAAQIGLDAVAVHVNVSSTYEPEMLRTLGTVSLDCESYGMPLVGIMYPRSESANGDNNYEDLKQNERKKYGALVAHAARVGVDLGVDLIKTQYTGDPDSFQEVTEACKPIPVVVAGGPVVPLEALLRFAYDVIRAGGAGISFGRNVFSREDPAPILSCLRSIVHDGMTAEDAQERLSAS